METISDISTVIYVLINLFIAYTLVFIERRSPEKTLAWLMIITLVPIVGIFLYVFFGRDLSRKKMFKEKRQEDIERLLESEKELVVKKKPVLKKQSQHYQLMNIALYSNNAPLIYNNSIEVLNNGEEKYPALLKAIDSAKKHIHLEYYIFRDKGIGSEILDLLIIKAQQGVEVRLLVDGMGNYIKRKRFNELSKNGVEYAIFFPTRLPMLVNMRLNYRNHRKIVVIDGKLGLFGGQNIGDEYLGMNKKYGYFRDTHYIVTGYVVHELQVRFAMDWEFASKKLLPDNRKYFPNISPTGDVEMQILTTGPDSGQPTIKQALYEMISNAQKKIQIVTPYYIPDASITVLLQNAILSGVEIEVIIPSVIDHPFVHWASTAHLSEIIDMGAKVYIYEKGFIHSKLVLVDDEISLIGTANFDIRSWSQNFEVSAIVYDDKFSKGLAEDFENDKDESIQLTKEIYANRDIKWKIKESFSRLLSPLL